MTGNHTKGPWHIGMKPGPIVYGPQGEQICDMIAPMLMDNEHKANAKLISAAPDLLDALLDAEREIEDLIEDHSHGDDDMAKATLVKIRAAIAKARGES